jgi:hypothetical protein
LAEQHQVVPHPLFEAVDGHWRVVRQPDTRAAWVDVVVLTGHRPSELAECLAAIVDTTDYPNYRIRIIDQRDDPRVARVARDWARSHSDLIQYQVQCQRPGNVAQLVNTALIDASEYVAIVDAEQRLVERDWLWEAIGLFERNPRAAVVGGRSFDRRGRLVGGAAVFGLNGQVGIAYGRRRQTTHGYFHLHLCQRNALAVVNAPMVLRRSLALDIGGFDPAYPERHTTAEFGARCHAAGLEVAVTPLITARVGSADTKTDGPAQSFGGAEELRRLMSAHVPLFRDDPFYSPFLTLDAKRIYKLAAPRERASYLNSQLQHLRNGGVGREHLADVSTTTDEVYRNHIEHRQIMTMRVAVSEAVYNTENSARPGTTSASRMTEASPKSLAPSR